MTDYFIEYVDSTGAAVRTLQTWSSAALAEAWAVEFLPLLVSRAGPPRVMRRTVVEYPAGLPLPRSLTWWLGRFYQSKFRRAAVESTREAADRRLRKQGIPATARRLTLGAE